VRKYATKNFPSSANSCGSNTVNQIAAARNLALKEFQTCFNQSTFDASGEIDSIMTKFEKCKQDNKCSGTTTAASTTAKSTTVGPSSTKPTTTCKLV